MIAILWGLVLNERRDFILMSPARRIHLPSSHWPSRRFQWNPASPISNVSHLGCSTLEKDDLFLEKRLRFAWHRQRAINPGVDFARRAERRENWNERREEQNTNEIRECEGGGTRRQWSEEVDNGGRQHRSEKLISQRDTKKDSWDCCCAIDK